MARRTSCPPGIYLTLFPKIIWVSAPVVSKTSCVKATGSLGFWLVKIWLDSTKSGGPSLRSKVCERVEGSSEGLINDGYRDKRVQNLNQTCSLYFCCNVGGFLWDVNSLWQVRAIYADRREGI